jgi:RNA polymerase sigma-70 factor (ECF subfamily)
MQKPWEIAETVYADETALLAGLRRGDRLACTCLLKQYMPRLYQLALQLTGQPDEAEDVVQESFIAACREIDRFEGRSRLGSWLHRIVLNTALMRLRRRRPTVSLAPTDDAEAAPVEIADPTPDPGAQLLSQELLGHIEQAVLALPDTLRAAVVLRDLEGLSTGEAAAALGIGESALKVRLHRGRLALRAALAPYLETPHPAGDPHE